jgi:hypothetical protein
LIDDEAGNPSSSLHREVSDFSVGSVQEPKWVLRTMQAEEHRHVYCQAAIQPGRLLVDRAERKGPDAEE